MSPITTSEALVLLHTVLTLSCALRVLYHQKNYGVALAWLVILFALPLIGLIAYAIIGEPKLGRTREKRKHEIMALYRDYVAAVPEDALQGVQPKWRALAKLAEHTTTLPPTDGHCCQLLNDADSMVEAMTADIAAARHSVMLMFYIIEPKGKIVELLSAVEAAAKRGVYCEIMADGVGSAEFFSTAWSRRLRKSGVVLQQSLSIGLIKILLVRSDLRNHRKLLLVDGKTAYTGSYNLVDPSVFKQGAGVGQWVDAMLRLQGPVVRHLQAVFAVDAGIENKRVLRDVPWQADAATDCANADLQDASAADTHTSVLQAVPSSPDQSNYVFYDMLICALHQARQRVVLTTPYFVPDDSLLLALTAAARRGVEVTLIVPARVDSFLVRHASHAYYRVLLQNGVKIALFRGGLLHTKSVVVDDEFALFGTVNMDMRSFYLNLELSLALFSAPEVSALALQQTAYLRDCDYLDAERWQRRSAWRTLLENIVRLMSPLL